MNSQIRESSLIINDFQNCLKKATSNWSIRWSEHGGFTPGREWHFLAWGKARMRHSWLGEGDNGVNAAEPAKNGVVKNDISAPEPTIYYLLTSCSSDTTCPSETSDSLFS